jgi:hypothetical protein
MTLLPQKPRRAFFLPETEGFSYGVNNYPGLRFAQYRRGRFAARQGLSRAAFPKELDSYSEPATGQPAVRLLFAGCLAGRGQFAWNASAGLLISRVPLSRGSIGFEIPPGPRAKVWRLRNLNWGRNWPSESPVAGVKSSTFRGFVFCRVPTMVINRSDEAFGGGSLRVPRKALA